jgi:hypothetical protein
VISTRSETRHRIPSIRTHRFPSHRIVRFFKNKKVHCFFTMRSSVLTIFVLAILAAGSLVAQTPTTAPDAQSSYEPQSNTGTGQEFLKRLVGNWNVVKTFFPASGQPNVESGICRQTMINGDRFLKSEFVFGTGDNQTIGLGLIGFDADTGKFTSVWIDSRSTRMSFRQSDDKFDGSEILLYGRSLNAPSTRPSRSSRTVTHLENNDNTLIHRQYVRLAGGRERLVLELLMTRRLPATRPAP